MQESTNYLPRLLSTVVPKLSFHSYKGQAGKVAVLGGSLSYTGAPYYAAMSSLKMGGDLATVFCPPQAATPIKSYSPELMVQPIMRTSDSIQDHSKEVVKKQVVDDVSDLLKKMTVLIVGPGLSRDEFMLECAADVIGVARQHSLPIIIDGDGLWLIKEKPNLISGYSRAILTPNAMEFQRLWNSLCPDSRLGSMTIKVDDDWLKTHQDENGLGFLAPSSEIAIHTAQLATKLGGVTIVRKGPIDIISDGKLAIYCANQGSPRRCGGQGDLIAGCIGLMTVWSLNAEKNKEEKEKKQRESKEEKEEKESKTDELSPKRRKVDSLGDSPDVKVNPLVLAAAGGCQLVRHAAKKAFAQHLRGMLTTDILAEIPASMQDLYPIHNWAKI